MVPAVRERRDGPDGYRLRVVGRGRGGRSQRVRPADRRADRPRLRHREHRPHRARIERRGVVGDRHGRQPLPVDDARFGDRVHRGAGRHDADRPSDGAVLLQPGDGHRLPRKVLPAGGRDSCSGRPGALASVGRGRLVVLLAADERGHRVRELDRAHLDRHGGGTRARYGPERDSRCGRRHDGGGWNVAHRGHQFDALHRDRIERERRVHGGRAR